jgi:hypothetical protein
MTELFGEESPRVACALLAATVGAGALLIGVALLPKEAAPATPSYSCDINQEATQVASARAVELWR